MINAIVQGIFNLILNLFNAIFSPVISGVMSLFPSLGNYFWYITTFLNQALDYCSVALDLLLVPRYAMVLLFDYFAIVYSIYLLSISVKFVITVYNKFKI